MARYNAERLISTIEHHLARNRGGAEVEPEVVQPLVQETALRPLPKTKQVFQESIFPELGRHISINRATPDSRWLFFKKVYLKFFGPIVNRQATFNAQTAKALELICEHLDVAQQHNESLKKQIAVEKQEGHRLRNKLQEYDEILDYLFHQNADSVEELWTAIDRVKASHEGNEKEQKLLKSEVQNNYSKQQENIVAQDTKNIELLNSINSLSTTFNHLKEEQSVLPALNQEVKGLISQLRDLQNHSQFQDKQIGEAAQKIDEYYIPQHQELESLKTQLHDLQNHSLYNDHRVEELKGNLTELDSALQDYSWVGTSYKAMEERIGLLEAIVQRVKIRIKEQEEFHALVAELKLSIEQQSSLPTQSLTTSSTANTNPYEHFLTSANDLAYHQFQLLHRGSMEQLRMSQRVYLELLEKNLKTQARGTGSAIEAVDLGCGDGVFVQLMKEHGWAAAGVDSNAIMVRSAVNLGLNVAQQDLFEYLKIAEPNSLDAITAFQVIEHLKPNLLKELLLRSFRALKPGGLLLLETINPKTVRALKWFFMDLTHEQLIMPETLQWLSETVGFETVEWRGVHPVEVRDRLENSANDANTAKLNDFLFGDQDYYFLARKP